jgi:hypothetical protein
MIDGPPLISFSVSLPETHHADVSLSTLWVCI